MKQNKNYKYPYNLLADLLDKHYAEMLGMSIDGQLSEDQLRGFRHALMACNSAERIALEIRYEKYGTLTEISERMGFTRERARQVTENALRRLRQPAQFNFIRYGYDATSKALVKQAKEREIVEKQERAAANGQAVDLKMGIEVLDISARAHTALMRAKLCTVGDIWNLSVNELRSIHGLGAKSTEEVLLKIYKLKISGVQKEYPLTRVRSVNEIIEADAQKEA